MFALVSPENSIIDILPKTFNHVAPQLRWVELPPDSKAEIGFLLNDDGSITNPRIPNVMSAIAIRTRVITTACQNQITGGFYSSALGQTYFYSSGLTDQQNIVQTCQCPAGGLISCSFNGNWSKIKHTQEQAQIVLNNFIEMRDQLRSRLDQIIIMLNKSTSIEQAMNISW